MVVWKNSDICIGGYHIGCLRSYPRLILLHVLLSRSKLGLAREKTRSPINRDNFYQTVYRRFAPQRGNNLIAGWSPD